LLHLKFYINKEIFTIYHFIFLLECFLDIFEFFFPNGSIYVSMERVRSTVPDTFSTFQDITLHSQSPAGSRLVAQLCLSASLPSPSLPARSSQLGLDCRRADRRRQKYYTSRLRNGVLSCSASALHLEVRSGAEYRSAIYLFISLRPQAPAAIALRSFLC